MNSASIDRIDWLGKIGFAEGLALQEKAVEEVLDGTSGNRFLLLEHKPVYTIGRTRDKSSLRKETPLPHPVIETNRGGKATFHGPGQLVGYAVTDLKKAGRDLHVHLRWLEDIVIALCAHHGVVAGRREGLTGVWAEDRKLASIGVGVRKWITMHGFALNVTAESLIGFEAIVPCGIDGVEMTSLETETREKTGVEAVAESCRELLQTPRQSGE